jgi:hypothetical protein
VHDALRMLDLEALTTINIEQIVTRTDLLLLRGRVHGLRSRRSFDFSSAAAAALAVSRARMAAHQDATKTMFVREPRASALSHIAQVARSVAPRSSRRIARGSQSALHRPSTPQSARRRSIEGTVSPMMRAALIAALVTWLVATALCLLA